MPKFGCPALALARIAAYEAGSRKVPASLLPTLAKLFAVPLEQLVGMESLQVNHIHANNRRVPWIRIQGQWLDQAGFAIDTPVQIHVMDGCLVFKAGQ